MPIEFVDRKNDGLNCAQWRVDFNSTNGEISEKFQLPGCKSNIHFNASCTYKKIPAPPENQTTLGGFGFGQPLVSRVPRKYDIELSLKQLNASNIALLSNDWVSHYYLQPCNSWIVTNENAKIALKRSSDKSEWNVKSGKFQVNISAESRADPNVSSFTCEIWIEFKSFGPGEIKALAHMADYLFVRQTHCDVHFTFEDGQQIGAHAQILSARSAVFAAMFNHDMQEAKTGKVVINDIKSDIFKELLHYVYMGRTKSLLTADTVQQLFVAVDKYDIADLRNECVDYLLSNIESKNAISIMVWADLHSVDNVKKAALDIVVRNVKEIYLTEEWEWLAKNYPELNVLVTLKKQKKNLTVFKLDIQYHFQFRFFFRVGSEGLDSGKRVSRKRTWATEKPPSQKTEFTL
ncbi:hypothetical protein GHT06_010240 [Daphnia sinensis]|uniref:BTB domain-containing protein n=1 Tax=Daphnia sinensis TaxID=1820382 RepID=A0AAD5Q0Y7_9CRUS|nr:hypothetical protein GHT06_010240 [Daphnia sinensis]